MRRWGRALKPGGVYLTQGGSAGWLLSLLFWQPILKLTSDKTRGLMMNPPDVDEILEVVEALTYVHEGNPRGKVLVCQRSGPRNGDDARGKVST